MIIDTHAHITDNKLNNKVEEIISNSKKMGVKKIITIGLDCEDSSAACKLAEEYDQIYFTVGYHPHNAGKYEHSKFKNTLRELSRKNKMVGLGEIGLDFYYDFAPRRVQIKVFKKQLKLADKYNLPIIIHSRDSYDQLIKILRKDKNLLKNSGVVHCFTGSLSQAKQIIDLGLYVSFGGIITFKNNDSLRNVALQIGLDNILVETDSPYLSPEPFRGKVNDPSRVALVVEKLANMYSYEYSDTVEILNRNTKQVFKKMFKG